jgi:hypothetical protein
MIVSKKPVEVKRERMEYGGGVEILSPQVNNQNRFLLREAGAELDRTVK